MAYFCTKCGKELEEGQRFCGFCGSMIKIPSDAQELPDNPVGEEAPADVNYAVDARNDAVNDGAQIPEPAPSYYAAPNDSYAVPTYDASGYADPNAQYVQKAPSSAGVFFKKHMGWFIAGSIVLVIAIVIICIVSASGGPAQTVMKYLEAQKSADYVQEYKLSYYKNFDHSKTLDEYIQEARKNDAENSSSFREHYQRYQKNDYQLIGVLDLTPDEISSEKNSLFKNGYRDVNQISDIKKVSVSVTTHYYDYSYHIERTNQRVDEYLAINVGGKWYVCLD